MYIYEYIKYKTQYKAHVSESILILILIIIYSITEDIGMVKAYVSMQTIVSVKDHLCMM